jgi:hypothetical protein
VFGRHWDYTNARWNTFGIPFLCMDGGFIDPEYIGKAAKESRESRRVSEELAKVFLFAIIRETKKIIKQKKFLVVCPWACDSYWDYMVFNMMSMYKYVPDSPGRRIYTAICNFINRWYKQYMWNYYAEHPSAKLKRIKEYFEMYDFYGLSYTDEEGEEAVDEKGWEEFLELEARMFKEELVCDR